jgi:hypothetical protein
VPVPVSVGVNVTVFVSVGEEVSLRVELPVPTLVVVPVPLEPPAELAVEAPVRTLVRLLDPELPAFELPLIAPELPLDPLLASGPSPWVGAGPPSSAKLLQSPMPSRLPHPPSQHDPRMHTVPRDAARMLRRVPELRLPTLIRTNLSSSSPLRPGRPSG